ncbi:outer membrane biogenesis protein BamB [Planctomycetes bacterium MalM25]|nr:outer membrane biogenesis protein BamB [Planctomycetes bacterium MalM25]
MEWGQLALYLAEHSANVSPGMPAMLRLLAAVCLASSAILSHAAGWPEFRGPGGQGHSPSPAPTTWSETENVVWKTDLPGRGWSSPVIRGNQIWVTSAIEKLGATEDQLASKTDGLMTAKNSELASSLSLQALCLDKRTGELRRQVELFTPSDIDVIHSLNSYASPTPVVEAGRLYCHFGTYGNACVDTTTGEVLWRRVLPVKHYVGPGSSPVLYEDLMVLTYDGANVQFVTALDKRTGETVWRTDRPAIRSKEPDFRKSYCTPVVFHAAGRDQLAVTGAQWIVSYNPRNGEELWRADHGDGFSVVPRPVAADGIVYFSSGFTSPEIIAVRADGSGDVTSTHLIARSRHQAPTMPSPLLIGDRLLTVSDKGVGVCLDLSLENLVWRKRMGGNYSASPLLAGGLVYFFNQEGLTTVLDAKSDEARTVSQNQLDGAIMATPAVDDGRLYLRTDQSLYCLGE